MKRRFHYEGSVYAFQTLVTDNWSATTYAESEKRAISNFKYRFRRKFNYSVNVPLSMPGNVIGGTPV